MRVKCFGEARPLDRAILGASKSQAGSKEGVGVKIGFCLGLLCIYARSVILSTLLAGRPLARESLGISSYLDC